MAGQEAVAMTPTSDMSLDDIIRELEAQRDKAREDMLAFVVEGVKSGRLRFGRTDPDDDDGGVYLAISDPVESYHEDSPEAHHAYIRRRFMLGERLDSAVDTLRRALNLRDALEGED
jgi:hypothetical protein